jgi:hypothetical protein
MLTSIAQKRHDVGASRCSKRSSASSAKQNHLWEDIPPEGNVSEEGMISFGRFEEAKKNEFIAHSTEVVAGSLFSFALTI